MIFLFKYIPSLFDVWRRVDMRRLPCLLAAADGRDDLPDDEYRRNGVQHHADLGFRDEGQERAAAHLEAAPHVQLTDRPDDEADDHGSQRHAELTQNEAQQAEDQQYPQAEIGAGAGKRADGADEHYRRQQHTQRAGP